MSAPSFLPRNFSSAKPPSALAAIKNRRPIRAQWSAQSRDDIALITTVSGRRIGGAGGCSIT
jgi:hypothetical protein